MSAGIFIFGLVVGIIFTIIATVFDAIGHRKTGLGILCANAIVILTIFTCAFLYKNFAHMKAAFKYDDVVVIDKLAEMVDNDYLKDLESKGYVCVHDENYTMYCGRCNKETVYVRDRKSAMDANFNTFLTEIN